MHDLDAWVLTKNLNHTYRDNIYVKVVSDKKHKMKV